MIASASLLMGSFGVYPQDDIELELPDYEPGGDASERGVILA
jgi:hypothetical protein